MAHYEHLPIYKSALDLCIYFEKIVRNFNRNHKYVIGADLRRLSMKAVMLIIKANDVRNKTPLLLQLKDVLGHFKHANTYRLKQRIKTMITTESIKLEDA